MSIVTPVVQPDYNTSPARFIETATGKQILLRGVNIQMDAGSSTVNMIDTLGCNMVRIACFWNQIEPTAPTGSGTNFSSYTHNFNSTALGQIDNLVSHCAGLTVQGNPVMVQIDLHQAGWSPFFGGSVGFGGTGVPSWYYTDSRFPGSNWTTAQKSTAIAAWWTTELSASQTLYIAYAKMMVARYSQHSNVVMYNSFNEPNPGNFGGASRAKTTMLHTWLAPVVAAMSVADTPTGGVPTRGISVMNRGGGEGYGDADFSPFGTQAQMQAKNMVLESHMYYVGLKPGYPATLSTDFGLNAAGDDYLPSSNAAHINLSPGYIGQQQYQSNFHSVYKTAASTLGLPWFHGEWGVNFDDSGWSAYQSQMQSYFDTNKVSCTRWLLAPVNGPGSLNLINNGVLTGTGNALKTWFLGTTFTLGGTTTAPVNTVAPSLNDDTPQVNEQLLCSVGTWTANPFPTFAFQWQTAASAGGPFTNVGVTTNTYTVPIGQLAQFLRCQITATNSAGSATANSEVTAAVAAAGGTVPVNTVAPVLTDTTRNQPASSGLIAGDILSTSNGTWSNTPTSFAYQWQTLNSAGSIANVAGDPSTSSQYDSSLADVGFQIRCQVTATNGAGNSVPANTAWTPVIPAPTNQNALIFYTSDNGTGANQPTAKNNLSNVPLTGSGVDLVVNGGDTYAIGKAVDFTADIPPVYGPTTGRNVYPLLVQTIGNHDWDNAAAGFDTFYTGKGTKSFISPHYGRIDIAGWTLIFLNGYQAKTQSAGTTTPAPDSSAGVGSTQLAWLQNNLPGGSSNPNGTAKQCIVFCHNMRYSCSQNHTDNANLDDVWKAIQGKAVAWVHGHAHNLSMQKQRDGSGNVAVDAADGTPSGIYDVCAGAGGEGNYAQNTSYTPAPLFFRGNATTPQFGYLLIKISGNAVTFEFHDQNSSFSGAPLFSKTMLGSPTNVVNPLPPVNTSAPTISDVTPSVQETLTVNPGTWTGAVPISFVAVWQISQDSGATWGPGTGTPIVPAGGTLPDYLVGAGDVGFPIRVRITASNSVGRVDAVSAATANVSGTTPTVPVLISAPVVSPTSPSIGTQVSTTDGVWLNTPTSFAYQWQESDTVGNITTLTGQTSSTYVVQSTDAGMSLSCLVTATNADGPSSSVPSNTTAAVTQIVPGQLTVNITDPANGATVTTTLVTVTVDAEDTDGIQSVEVRALRTDGTWTGAWVQAFGAYPLFSAQLALAGGDGEYEVDARATANAPAV